MIRQGIDLGLAVAATLALATGLYHIIGQWTEVLFLPLFLVVYALIVTERG